MSAPVKTEAIFIAPASSAPAFISPLPPKKEIAADKTALFWGSTVDYHWSMY